MQSFSTSHAGLENGKRLTNVEQHYLCLAPARGVEGRGRHCFLVVVECRAVNGGEKKISAIAPLYCEL